VDSIGYDQIITQLRDDYRAMEKELKR
jgi:hypothetical protein